MPYRPLTRLDSYLPVTVGPDRMGMTQHLSLEALALDGIASVRVGDRLDVILRAREDQAIPLGGSVRSIEILESGPRALVVFEELSDSVRADLIALLSGVRKASHLALCTAEDVEADRARTGFGTVRFPHLSLPEIDADAIDLGVEFLGKRLAAPIVVAGMTGGSSEGREVNRALAETAQASGLAMGLGSQRAMLESPDLLPTYSVRDVAPDILLLANLGAVQLGLGMGVEECREAVESVGADALVLHLNPLQEMVQPEGDRNWSGIIENIATVCEGLEVPVLLKETGAGLSARVARIAQEIGVAALDVGGSGGTSWGYIEGFRSGDPDRLTIGQTFRNWGIPTLDSLRSLRQTTSLPLICTGGVRTGLDVAKAVSEGAIACGVALPFLRAAREGGAIAAARLADRLVEELRIAAFCTGSIDLDALRRVPLEPV